MATLVAFLMYLDRICLAEIVGSNWEMPAQPSTRKDQNKCRLKNLRSLTEVLLNKQASVVPANVDLRTNLRVRELLRDIVGSSFGGGKRAGG
jgi:hypothetical protein